MLLCVSIVPVLMSVVCVHVWLCDVCVCSVSVVDRVPCANCVCVYVCIRVCVCVCVLCV